MKESLKEAGLSPRESEIYVMLVKLGQTTANTIAKRLDIDRTVTYNILNKLIIKGFVTHITKKSRRYYQVTDLNNLLRPLKEKESIIEKTIKDLKNVQKETPAISYIEIFEGKEGLKSVYEIALKLSNTVFYSMGVTGKSLDILGYSFPNLKERIKRNKIKIKVIANFESKNHKFTKENIVETRYLDKKSINKATTSIFGEYVAINLSDKPIIILIKNKDMAKGYKNYFEILWKIANK